VTWTEVEVIEVRSALRDVNERLLASASEAWCVSCESRDLDDGSLVHRMDCSILGAVIELQRRVEAHDGWALIGRPIQLAEDGPVAVVIEVRPPEEGDASSISPEEGDAPPDGQGA
jgi:hypothetical protein